MLSPERSFVIRAATRENARAIAEVHVASWISAYTGMIPQEILDGLSVDKRELQWIESLGDPETKAFVAELDARVVGFSVTGPEDDGHELGAIYLLENVWGRGLGRALLDHSLDDLRARSIDEVTLWVLEANERARRFYEAGGWIADGARKDCFGEASSQAPAIRYRLKLLTTPAGGSAL